MFLMRVWNSRENALLGVGGARKRRDITRGRHGVVCITLPDNKDLELDIHFNLEGQKPYTFEPTGREIVQGANYDRLYGLREEIDITFSGNDYGGGAMWGEITASEHSLPSTLTPLRYLSTCTCNIISSGNALCRSVWMTLMLHSRLLCGRSYGETKCFNRPPDCKTPKLSYQKMRNENIYHHGKYHRIL